MVSGSAIISCICLITLLDRSSIPLLEFGLSLFIRLIISVIFVNLNFKVQFGWQLGMCGRHHSLYLIGYFLHYHLY